MPRRVVRCLAALAIVLTACSDSGSTSDTTRDEPAAPRTLRVPKDHDTIQAAVDAARPGDLVLVSPGTYRESVTIETERVTVRGTDRNEVVLDGGGELENGVMALADGVAVENLTVHDFRSNGVFFTGDYGRGAALVGYRASYVTSYDNGLYGVYAFNARGGSVDHVYVSGHPDSGIYIGQCNPCDAIVSDVKAELNAVGYEGTNASGNLAIVRSVWTRNRVGLAPSSSTREELAPQRDVSIVGNVISYNADEGAARATDGFGVGIAVGGGEQNLIQRNRVIGHPAAGILLLNQETFQATGNVVRDNVLAENGVDLVDAVAVLPANCFADNTFTSSSPSDIEAVLPCPGTSSLPSAGAPVPVVGPPAPVDPLPAPLPHPTMPDAETTPPNPPTGAAVQMDLSVIPLPAAA